MKKLLFSLVLTFCLSFLAVAQEEEYDKGEFFAGYSSATYLIDEEPAEHGFAAAGVYNFHKYVGIKTEVSGTYRSLEGRYYFPASPNTDVRWKGRHNLYNFTGGVQFKDNRKDSTFKPFGHIMVGYGNHFDTVKTACPSGAICPPINVDSEGVSVIVGGGLDIKVNKRIDVRVLQLDINGINSKNNGAWVNGRFSAGVVVKF